jgi:hypothetical protein
MYAPGCTGRCFSAAQLQPIKSDQVLEWHRLRGSRFTVKEKPRLQLRVHATTLGPSLLFAIAKILLLVHRVFYRGVTLTCLSNLGTEAVCSSVAQALWPVTQAFQRVA